MKASKKEHNYRIKSNKSEKKKELELQPQYGNEANQSLIKVVREHQ